MDKEKVECEQVMQRPDLVAFLEGLAKQAKAGTLILEHGGESATLPLAQAVEVEVEAKRKKDKAKFSLELSWRIAAQEVEEPRLEVGDAPRKPEAAPTETPQAKPAKAEEPAKPKVGK